MYTFLLATLFLLCSSQVVVVENQDLIDKGYTKSVIGECGITVFWKPVKQTDTTVSIALRRNAIGWIGMGWPKNGDFGMVGSDAVIGWAATNKDPAQIKSYVLNGKIWLLVNSNKNLPLTDTSATEQDGKTTIFFTRSFASGNNPVADKNNMTVILATLDNDKSLSKHSCKSSKVLSLQLTDGPSPLVADVTKLDTLKMMALYSYSSYCTTGLKDWQCYWCTVDPKLPNVKVAEVFEGNALVEANGFIGVTNQAIIISFRGSDSVGDWIADALFWKRDYPNAPGASVHAGFLDAYLTVKTKLRTAATALVAANPSLPIWITGHSLGGALAVLCSLDFVESGLFPNTFISMYSLGQPRVGNQAFADYYHTKVPNGYRIVNHKDLVAHIPPDFFPFSYRFQSVEVYFYLDDNYTEFKICRNIRDDPNCKDDDHLLYNPLDHMHYLGFNILDAYNADKGCGFVFPVLDIDVNKEPKGVNLNRISFSNDSNDVPPPFTPTPTPTPTPSPSPMPSPSPSPLPSPSPSPSPSPIPDESDAPETITNPEETSNDSVPGWAIALFVVGSVLLVLLLVATVWIVVKKL